MANKFLITPMDDTPKQIAFANFAGDFSPAAAKDLRIGTPTTGELVLLDLANSAAAQSAKVDLGAKFAERYACVAVIEMQVAAAGAGTTVEFYWNASPSATAANANMGATTGSSAGYDGYSADLVDAIKQLLYIGSMVMADDAVDSIQTGFVGDLYPPHRYGSLIVRNLTGQKLCDTDDVEAHVVLNPVIPELQ